jgi:hypothetical protein
MKINTSVALVSLAGLLQLLLALMPQSLPFNVASDTRNWQLFKRTRRNGRLLSALAAKRITTVAPLRTESICMPTGPSIGREQKVDSVKLLLTK